MNTVKKYFHHHLARPVYSIIRPLQPIFNLKKRAFFDKFKVTTKDGVRFWLYNNAFYWETEIFWIGYIEINWEKKTREIWATLARESQVILDIGANTGIFSVIAKAYNKKAEIHAFEPQPNVFSVLQKNNQINDYDIQSHPLALSDKKGELPFYNTGYSTFENNNTTHGSLNKEWRTEHQHSILVKVERLDHFLDKIRCGEVDLMKIDVETLELEVLKGYGEKLWEDRPIIILEIQNPEIGDKLCQLFQSKHYLYYLINEENGIYPIEELGRNTDQDNLNYLLCPQEKKKMVKRFLGNG